MGASSPQTEFAEPTGVPRVEHMTLNCQMVEYFIFFFCITVNFFLDSVLGLGLFAAFGSAGCFYIFECCLVMSPNY